MTKNCTLKYLLFFSCIFVAISVCVFIMHVQQEKKPRILKRMERADFAYRQLSSESTEGMDLTIKSYDKKIDTPDNIGKVKARRSLLIFGEDRSGTTFTSAIFAQDPKIFLVYEPLWITKGFTFRKAGFNCSNCELEVVNAIVSCKFSRYHSVSAGFLPQVENSWTAASPINIFKTKPFCNLSSQSEVNCSKMLKNPNFVDRICKEKFKHSVVKVSPVRLPRQKMADLVPQVLLENPETEVRVLHLLRDPRGIINSRIDIEWIREYPHRSLVWNARELCDAMLSDLEHVERTLEKFNLTRRYKSVRYSQLAEDPVGTAKDIYKFAGFEFPSVVEEWIIRSTTPSKKQLKKELGNPYSTVRNATGNAYKWRNDNLFPRNQAIERECRPLMNRLGLKEVPEPLQKKPKRILNNTDSGLEDVQTMHS